MPELYAEDVPFLPKEYELINLGDHINTEGFEYAATIELDGRSFYYTTNREGSYGFLGTEMPSHDVWMVEVSDSLLFSSPKHIKSDTSKPQYGYLGINTPYHEGTVCLNSDYTLMFVVYAGREDGYGDNDIFYCARTDTGWSYATNFGNGLNSKYSETMPNVSPDGTKLFFVSDRTDNGSSRFNDRRNYDIWYCDFDFGANMWDIPRRLEAIRTYGNEEAPFALADDKTLVFASDKLKPNYGGYDLYYTKYNEETGEWSKPKNLGKPINSSKDERFFAMSPTGEYAIVTSNRSGGEGHLDLYYIDLREFNANKEAGLDQ